MTYHGNMTNDPASTSAQRASKTRPKWTVKPKYVGESLYRDEHGGYHTKFQVGGKQVARRLKTSDKTLARARRDELKAQLTKAATHGAALKVASMAFSELADAWLAHKKGELQASSLERVEGIVKAFKKEFGLSKLRDLSPAALAPWRSKRAPQINGATFNKELEVLGGIFEYGVEVLGVMTFNPAEKIKRIKARSIDKRKAVIPTREQFTKLLAELRDSAQATRSGAADCALFLGLSGLRIGEAVAVRVGDVSFEMRTLRVIAGKGHAERMLPLFPPLHALLKRLISSNPLPERVLFPFEGENGIRQALANACARAGLPSFTHHSFRHFFCSNAIESGVDFKVIAEWLGHKDGGVLVAKTYGHLRADHAMRMAQLITFNPDAAVAPPPTNLVQMK
ncbi:MAG: hypothetical protein QOE70_933 [Chthoniobacter sp.]|jgi:integrase|nr:hypothetical protein [Chthoniobacter sp.]